MSEYNFMYLIYLTFPEFIFQNDNKNSTLILR